MHGCTPKCKHSRVLAKNYIMHADDGWRDGHDGIRSLPMRRTYYHEPYLPIYDLWSQADSIDTHGRLLNCHANALCKSQMIQFDGNRESANLKTFSLDILEAAKPVPWMSFNMNHSDATLTEGHENELTLDCSVKGVPRPTVTWTKDGKPFPGAYLALAWNDTYTLSEDNQKVMFTFLTAEQSGEYKCNVKNLAGELAYKRSLTVEEHNSVTKGAYLIS